MIKFISENKIGVIALGLGLFSMIVGIYRQEHFTVLMKAINICLECVGIG